jgi:hypothetical protein
MGGSYRAKGRGGRQGIGDRGEARGERDKDTSRTEAERRGRGWGMGERGKGVDRSGVNSVLTS